MATRDDIYNAIRNADKAGDTASVQKLAAYLQTMPADSTPVHVNSPATTALIDNDAISQGAKDATGPVAYLKDLAGGAGDLAAGAVRGAGSIGTTLITASQKLHNAFTPNSALAWEQGLDKSNPPPSDGRPTLTSLVTGQVPLSADAQRRQDMDDALRSMGADTSSPAYKVGKVGAEVAGTAGVGPALAATLKAAPVVAAVAPNLIRAIESGGMSAGTATGATNALTRVAGGAVTGGASAGLVDPSTAGSGALVGGALPAAAKVVGTAGNALGNLVRGPAQTPEAAAAIQAARDAGYVIPPTQANPTLANRLLEGLAGKITTAQNASARNASVTNDLVGADIGLPAGTTITPEVLEGLRKKAGEAYANVAGLGKFNAAGADLPAAANVQKGRDILTLAPKSEVDAKDLVNAWKQANSDSNAYHAAYGRDANPETLAKANSAGANADAIHDFLKTQIGAQEGQTADQLLAAVAAGKLSTADLLKKTLANVERSQGAPGAVDALDAARTQIAKTYGVGKATNAETGTVNALQLAAQKRSGAPLTGGLDTAASFAARFPKAAQVPEKMGSLPGVSPLDFMTSAITPDKLLSVLTLGARPAARALALSPLVQNRLIQSQAPNALTQLLTNQQLAQLGYRVAPGAVADR